MENQKKKVVTFGELLLRLSPEGYYRFLQADHFNAVFGGAEANVAVALTGFGMDTAFVSKLPTHDIGQLGLNFLRGLGVDTSFVARGGERVGIYYYERGASQRASGVIYDRAHSSIAEASEADFDWDAILTDAAWFHFTGITAALSPEMAKICLQACKKAKEKGIPVSCDVNYRSKLWSIEQARKTMAELLHYVDVCVNPQDLFGIDEAETLPDFNAPQFAGYMALTRRLQERFGISQIAYTRRNAQNANENSLAGLLCDGKTCVLSHTYEMRIVDRIGGGDSMTAGLIYALLQGKNAQDSIEFAVAAGCLKHAVEGDVGLMHLGEVEALVAGNDGGRVKR